MQTGAGCAEAAKPERKRPGITKDLRSFMLYVFLSYNPVFDVLCKIKILIQQLDHAQRRVQEELDVMAAAGRSGGGQSNGQKAMLPQLGCVAGKVLGNIADMIGTVFQAL